jgi:hypothetical protein
MSLQKRQRQRYISRFFPLLPEAWMQLVQEMCYENPDVISMSNQQALWPIHGLMKSKSNPIGQFSILGFNALLIPVIIHNIGLCVD